MAKLHEMRWGGHAQADNESPQESTQELTQTLGFHARRNKMHKQTDVKRKRKGRGEEPQQPAVLRTGLLCPPSNKLGHRWAAQFARHSGSFRGHRMKSKIGGENKRTQKFLPAGGDTYRGARGSQKAPTE